jgi:hypothetical protein
MRIEIEFYKTGNGYGAWISDNCGGSGIEVNGASAEEVADNMKLYIMDYVSYLDKDDSEDDSNEVD